MAERLSQVVGVGERGVQTGRILLELAEKSSARAIGTFGKQEMNRTTPKHSRRAGKVIAVSPITLQRLASAAGAVVCGANSKPAEQGGQTLRRS